VATPNASALARFLGTASSRVNSKSTAATGVSVALLRYSADHGGPRRILRIDAAITMFQ